jgi:hypothetical protein
MAKDVLGWTLLVIFAIAVVLGVIFLSPPARLRRRLKKTHSRIISKAQRPAVKLSVKPPKEKK